MKHRLLLILLVVSVIGCEKILGPDPDNTPENNFEIFWKDFDMYYAQFGIRRMDWDSVYVVTRPRISPQTTDRQLFNILSDVVLALNDMHTTLYTPFGDVYYRGMSRGIYPSSKFVNPGKYVVVAQAQGGVMEYRRSRSDNFGYISISTFEGGSGLTLHDERYLVVDNILQQFKNTSGLLIDIRWNSGGNSLNAETVASRFADTRRVYSKYRTKNGPGKNDFSGWISRSIEPEGAFQYTKPVVVLTSRATCSAAECFVMAMRVLPHVTVVGDTTGGGIGNPVFRELPNGWTYRLSTEIGATADGYVIEGVGISPDVPVQTTVADSANGIDRIIEKGIEIIQSSRRN